MKEFFQNLFGGVNAWLTQGFRVFALDLIKIHAVMWYLRAIRTAHKMYLLCLATTLSMTLVGSGFILFHIGLYALLPAPANAIALTVLGLIYVITGLCIMSSLSSEKRWIKASGADECISELHR